MATMGVQAWDSGPVERYPVWVCGLEPLDPLEVSLADHLVSPEHRRMALSVLEAAIEAARPDHALRRVLRLEGSQLHVGERTYDLRRFRRVLVVGAGKAAAAMAATVEDVLGDRISQGIVVTKYGYTAPTRRIEVREGGHPVPDGAGVEAARRIVALVQDATAEDLVLCLISGGGSALLILPAPGISLEDQQGLTRLLLRSGATINEMNVVRKHLSQVKGGGLARLAAPASLVSLILSDVVGDSLDVIASGPTVPDSSTFEDACRVIDRYGLWERVPQSIARRLREGRAGLVPETPKSGDPVFRQVYNLVVANNEAAALGAAAKARALGFQTMVLSTFIEGEAREVGRVFAGIARAMALKGQPLPRPACLIAGGETTVTVRGQGLGGRNQELALAAAASLQGLQDVLLVSAATDGGDGPTDAAGALVDGSTMERARQLGLDPGAYLADNDSYHFFQKLGDLVRTGPTNTNVNDLVMVFTFSPRTPPSTPQPLASAPYLVIGIPSFNNASTIGRVVAAAAQGAARYFPGFRTLVVNSDGGSTDGTPEAAMRAPVPPGVEVVSVSYRGLPGKGSALRAVFQAAAEREARACLVLDSDLRSVTPEWVERLVAPVIGGGYGFVAPHYVRHKYDGTITNSLAYPITRALYGYRVRQPIGGDFAFTGELARLYLDRDVWDTDVARFGIDIFMTVTAINEGYRLCQAHLGAKVHDPKDPASSLGPMFAQVVGTIFSLMGTYQSRWLAVAGSEPVPLWGSPIVAVPRPVRVHGRALVDRLKTGAAEVGDLWQRVLALDTWRQVQDVLTRSYNSFAFPADTWARAVYDSAVAYNFPLRDLDRQQIVSALVPLYHGRTAALVLDTREMGPEEFEQYVEDQALVFEMLKPYLVERWSAANRQ